MRRNRIITTKAISLMAYHLLSAHWLAYRVTGNGFLCKNYFFVLVLKIQKEKMDNGMCSSEFIKSSYSVFVYLSVENCCCEDCDSSFPEPNSSIGVSGTGTGIR